MTRAPDVLLRTPEGSSPPHGCAFRRAASHSSEGRRVLACGVHRALVPRAPSQVNPEDCGSLLEGADHLTCSTTTSSRGGSCSPEFRTPSRSPSRPARSSSFPTTTSICSGSHLDLPPVPSRQVVRAEPGGGLWAIRHGGGGERTRIVCGFLGCDRLTGNPLTEALPPVLAPRHAPGSNAAAWIKSSLEFAADEIAARRAGSETVLAKLSELLFVETLRRYVEGLPEEQTGWLAALKDPFVSRALSLLHGGVGREWTVDELGRKVGLSRSALADALHAPDRRAAHAVSGALAHPGGRPPAAQHRHALGAHRRAGRLRVGGSPSTAPSSAASASLPPPGAKMRLPRQAHSTVRAEPGGPAQGGQTPRANGW